MRKIVQSFLGGLLIVSVSSCSNDDTEIYNNENKEVSVVATISTKSDRDSRVILSPSVNDDNKPKVTVSWDNEDAFSVIGSNENKTFSKTEAGNVFTGVMPSNKAQDGNYYGFYPVNITAVDVTDIPFSLSTQSGTLDKSKTYMYAVSEDGETFDFKHITALLMPKFTGVSDSEKIKSITIALPSTSQSQSSISLSENGVNIGVNSICINYRVASNVNDERYVYLPPISKQETLSFQVLTDASKIYEGSLTLKGEQEVVSGKLYTATISLSEIELDEYVWSGTMILEDGYKPQNGDGTVNNPYQIDKAKDLQWMIDNHYTLGKGVYYKQTHNLVIETSAENGKYWTPIGNEQKAFMGNFDGNGCVISGTLIVESTNEAIHLSSGLFGVANGGAEISNVNLNADVIGGSATNDGNYKTSVGGIVGTVYSASIKGCSNSGNISINESCGGYIHIAGIVGYLSNGSVYACVNYGKITGGFSNNTRSNCYTGGVVGYNIAPISFCDNYGEVIGGKASLVSSTGGITGYSYSTLLSCTNNGAVKGCTSEASSNSYTGGVAGGTSSSSKMRLCINNAIVVSGLGNWGTNTGLLVGYNDGYVCTCCKDISENELSLIGGGNRKSQSKISDCTASH